MYYLLLSTSIYLFLLFCQGNTQKGFIISFQSSDKLSVEEWAKYTGEISRLSEFTACHWEKSKWFSKDRNTIWSYCTKNDDDTDIYCTQYYYKRDIDTGNRHMITYQKLPHNIKAKVKLKPFPHRSWNHVCWSYSSKSLENQLFFNGQLIQTYKIKKKEIVPGSSEVKQSSFVIGQEPDKIDGGYEIEQVFIGDITEVNIWSKILQQTKISKMAICSDFSKGNVVSWEKEKWNVNKAVVADVNDMKIICEKPVWKIFFPIKSLLLDAKATCEGHGGRVCTPVSEQDNEDFKKLALKYKENCEDPCKD